MLCYRIALVLAFMSIGCRQTGDTSQALDATVNTCSDAYHPEGPTTEWQYDGATCSCKFADNVNHTIVDGGNATVPGGKVYSFKDPACAANALVYECSSACRQSFGQTHDLSRGNYVFYWASASLVNQRKANAVPPPKPTTSTTSTVNLAGGGKYSYWCDPSSQTIYIDYPKDARGNAIGCARGYGPDMSWYRQSCAGIGLTAGRHTAQFDCVPR